MLSLDSPRWASLEHAYGAAGDIPPLLARLAQLPSDEGDADPWFSLWSALAHQGDVYAASLAAVPHVVAALAAAPQRACASYFQFPAWVEVCRQRQALALPEDLAVAYRDALARLPALAAAAGERDWDEGFARCALAAIAAAKGQTALAAALLELAPDVLQDLPAWLEER